MCVVVYSTQGHCINLIYGPCKSPIKSPLAIYRALRWSPGHSSEDARSRYIPDTKRQRPFRTFCRSTVRRFSLVDNDVVIAETGWWQEVGLPMRGSGCNTVSYSYSTSNSLCFLFPGLPVPCSCI